MGDLQEQRLGGLGRAAFLGGLTVWTLTACALSVLGMGTSLDDPRRGMTLALLGALMFAVGLLSPILAGQRVRGPVAGRSARPAWAVVGSPIPPVTRVDHDGIEIELDGGVVRVERGQVVAGVSRTPIDDVSDVRTGYGSRRGRRLGQVQLVVGGQVRVLLELPVHDTEDASRLEGAARELDRVVRQVRSARSGHGDAADVPEALARLSMGAVAGDDDPT